MVYILGRDTYVGVTTEQPHYALELDSYELKVSGTAANAYDSDKVFIPRRRDVGTTAEVSTITFVSAYAVDYESLASNNQYVLLYNSSGEKYLIWFDHDTTGVKPTGINEDFEQEVDLQGLTAHPNALTTGAQEQLTADSDFAAAFTFSASGNVLTITDKVTGSATDIVRGSGFADNDLTVGTTTAGANVSIASNTAGVKLSDVTGIDFGFGTTDEDISFFGQRTALKAEIKKEMTLSITRKKSDNGWSQVFNSARNGIRATALATSEMSQSSNNVEMDNNLNRPFSDVNGSGFGYRVYLEMKNGDEVLSLPNCCITEYAISLAADGTQEETITFYSNVKPIISSLIDDTTTTGTNF